MPVMTAHKKVRYFFGSEPCETDKPSRAAENNLRKLESIARLGKDWNGYGAAPFSQALIGKVREIVLDLHVQPELFPTAAGSIQLEYEKDSGDYLEIQVTESSVCDVFRADSCGEASFTVLSDASEINKLVGEFYD